MQGVVTRIPHDYPLGVKREIGDAYMMEDNHVETMVIVGMVALQDCGESVESKKTKYKKSEMSRYNKRVMTTGKRT